MKNFFRTLFLTLLLCMNISPLFAQTGSSPKDSFYVDAKRWEILGLTTSQPKQKPYPIFVIDDILTQVENSDNDTEATIARAYRNQIINKPVNLFAELQYLPITGSDSNIAQLTFGGYGDVAMSENIGISYLINGVFTNNNKSFANRFTHDIPLYTGLSNDRNGDSMVFGDWMEGFFETNTTLSYGKPNLYLMTGISRSHLGNDLYDSIILSKESYHAPYALIFAQEGNLSFVQGIQFLTATDGNGSSKEATRKFLAYHEIDWDLLPWLTIYWNESAVFGEHFEFQYLIPAFYITTESFAGFSGNMLMGLGAKITPINRFTMFCEIFIDDVNSHDIAKLQFDTRMTGAGIAGIQYAPDSTICRLVSGSYTLVTPWMYSHYHGDGKRDTVNYQNYLHNGLNKATQLPPNSHRLSISGEFSPISNLKTTIGLNLIQHANISESLETKEAAYYMHDHGLNSNNEDIGYNSDGTVNQAGYNGYPDGKDYKGYLSSYIHKFQFLEQKTIETTLQLNSNIDYQIHTDNLFTISIFADYTFEYIHNFGTTRDIFKPNTYLVDKSDEENVERALSAWRDSIIPHTFNNYLTFGCRIVY